MTESFIDGVFWSLAAIVGAFVFMFPNAFVHLANYGGRLDYKAPMWMLMAMRVCGAVMLFFIVKDLL
jgi:hypothetical protein